MKKVFSFLLLFFAVSLATQSFAQVYFHKTYGDSGLGSDDGYYWGCTRQTSDGGYIMTTYTRTYSVAGDGDVYLIKTDANGDTLWTKTYGGNGTDGGTYVEQTTDGGYIIAGVADSCCSGVAGNVILIKTDSNGDTLWTRTYVGINTEQAYSALQTSDGGYIITGWTNSFQPSGQAFLIKTNTNGDTLC